VLHRGHNQFAAGHFGIEKTERRILDSNYWWLGIRKFAEDSVGNCKICICTKLSNRCYTHSGRRPFPLKPLDLISIDFIVELPVTEHENRHIMTIVDQFTKFLCVYPCQDRTAKTAARCIYDFSLRYGIPLKILSDQDPAYESDLFGELMHLFRVKKLRTTAYNPRSNGLTERLNGVIKPTRTFQEGSGTNGVQSVHLLTTHLLIAQRVSRLTNLCLEERREHPYTLFSTNKKTENLIRLTLHPYTRSS
jgi:Integrase core domain.